jgi:Zn-dependent protease with chaperone function
VTVLVTSAAAVVLITVVLSLRAGRHASPRLRAITYLVALVGLALLPVAGLICSGTALAGVVTGSVSDGLGCGWSVRLAAWGPLAAGQSVAMLGVLGVLVVHGVRVLAAAARTELGSLVRVRATPHTTRGGGSVWVVSAETPAAHTCGLRHPQAVVTTGLLALLEPAEQQAVCEHEAAHVRLGHHRLLLVGAPIARAYGFVPLVRGAWSGLRRELEVAADDEAARQVGTEPLLSALARVGLARVGAVPGAAAGFADSDHLRYRIARLQNPQPSTRSASAAVAAGALTLAVGFTWTACTLAVGNPALTGAAACLTVLVGIGLRPLWSWHHNSRPGPNVVT